MRFFVRRVINVAFMVLVILVLHCSFTISNEPLPGSDSLKPEEYDLVINANLDNESGKPLFGGCVEIKVNCIKRRRQIFIDGEYLQIAKENIKAWNVDTPDDTILAMSTFTFQGKRVITLNAFLIEQQHYVIRIEFSSYGWKNTAGYIVDHHRLLAYTLTDYHAAELIFPCFNQIELKAKVKIILGHKRHVRAFSMTKSVGQYTISNQTEWVEEEFVIFENPLSTYSINFTLSPYKCANNFETISLSDIAIQVCSENEYYLPLMDYIAVTINDIFHYIINYLSVAYPLGKFDMIVRSGENLVQPNENLVQPHGNFDITEGFGLVNTDMKYLSRVLDTDLNDILSNPSFKYDGISRLCNVISHQWFGHMVTMSLDENWVLAGLNIFIQWNCATEEHKFENDGQFFIADWDIISSFLYVLKKEDIGDWISMPKKGNSDWAIASNSLDIKYRAAHLIRMVYFFMGNEVFTNSLKSFTVQYQYKNTTPDQFWTSFAKTASDMNEQISPYDQEMGKTMKNWIQKNGHPLIKVERNNRTDESVVTLRQETFLPRLEEDVYTVREIENVAGQGSKDEKCRIIPLSYAFGNKENYSEAKVVTWFPCEGKANISIENLKKDDWLVINLELNVLSRVNYDLKDWFRIRDQLLHNPERFKTLTRVRLLSDLFTMAKAGLVHYYAVFSTTKYLIKEESYAPWKVAMEELHEIRSRLMGINKKVYEAFMKYVRRLLEPVFKKMKNTNHYAFPYVKRNPSELKLSVLIMEEACRFGVKICLKLASKILKKRPIFENGIPHSINKAIHCHKVMQSEKHSKNLWKQYLNGGISNETKEGILEALGCSNNIKYLKDHLNSILTNEKVSQDDRVLIFKSLASNENGFHIMKEFFVSNYENLKRLDENEANILPFWQILFDITKTGDTLSELMDFEKKNIAIYENKEMKKSIANAERNINWLNSKLKELNSIFLSNEYYI